MHWRGVSLQIMRINDYQSKTLLELVFDHVFCDLKAVVGQGILSASNSSLHLKTYANADYGNCVDTKRSTIRQCVPR